MTAMTLPGASPAVALLRRPQIASLAILLLVLVGFGLASPTFLSARNIGNMLAFMPELGIIALGMCLLLTAGEFDLSVGAVFGFVPCVVFILAQSGSMDIGAAILVGLAIALGIGLVNGLLVVKVWISSFLVTLATMLIVRGAALYVTQGFPLDSWRMPSAVVTLLAGSFDIGGLRVHASLIWFAALTLLAAYILNLSRLGNWISAIGSNRAAAVARGVPADAVKIGLFMLVALLAALAGLISAFRISNASPVAGTNYELEVIAMVVVGGTALTGGYGTILGTIVGVMLLRAIRNGIIMVGVPGLAYTIFVGGIILVMLVVHAALRRAGGQG